MKEMSKHRGLGAFPEARQCVVSERGLSKPPSTNWLSWLLVIKPSWMPLESHHQSLTNTPSTKISPILPPTKSVCAVVNYFQVPFFHNSWIQVKVEKCCSHRTWTRLLKSFSQWSFSSRSYTVENTMGSIWNPSLYLLERLCWECFLHTQCFQHWKPCDLLLSGFIPGKT